MSISQNTKFSLTIGGVFTAVVVLVGVGWRAANIIRDVGDEVKALRNDVKGVSADRWSASDMERWAYRLDLANRERSIIVPDPRTIRADRERQ